MWTDYEGKAIESESKLSYLKDQIPEEITDSEYEINETGLILSDGCSFLTRVRYSSVKKIYWKDIRF